MGERVVVAMSGGLDSSVAAARLVAEGHEVVGVTLHLWDYPDDGSVRGRCCAPEDIHDARRVAHELGFPHYAFDRRELFQREVVSPFVDAYLGGTTPSPCVTCNRAIKIPELLAVADALGAHTVATGHYARIVREDGVPRLYRARDERKDQSYFLHMLGAGTLARLRFPLGDDAKASVREEASRLGLGDKGESQELCFVPTGRYDAFVAERAGGRLSAGDIVDETGRTVGRHTGIHAFTIGQRRHLGVALGRRRHVVGIDADRKEVRLGPPSALDADRANVSAVTLGDGVGLPLACEVAVRYRGKASKASVRALGPGRVEVAWKAPLGAIVPGQVAVFYHGDRVLGGGTIETAWLARSERQRAQSVEI